MKEHPEVAESVMIPPKAWKDLYNYFDAVDLWKEGPGFLFHVLGFIQKVNLTRFNCVQRYVRDWVSRNEERIANIPATQDLLSYLTTDEDHAWFDFDNLTMGERGAVRSALMCHRDGLQRRQESFHFTQSDDMKIRALRDPSIVSMERQRPCGAPGKRHCNLWKTFSSPLLGMFLPNSKSVNPPVCSPIHTYLRPIIDHSLMKDFQAHSRSNSHYHNRDLTQSHTNPMRDTYVGAMPGAEDRK